MIDLNTYINEGLECCNMDFPIYNEMMKMLDSKTKKEWKDRLNYLYSIITPQWTRVYRQSIPVNKEDSNMYMIVKFYSHDDLLYDKGLTGEIYIGFNGKKCYKIYPAWKSGDLDMEKYGKKFNGIKCIKLDKKINDIQLDHTKIENIYIIPKGFHEMEKVVKKMTKL